MKLFGAIDLRSNASVTLSIDEKNEVVYQKRQDTDIGLREISD